MDWWTRNKDAIAAIGAVLTGILALGGVVWAIMKRGWQKNLRVDVKVFEVITDSSVLLPKLFATENDDSPLADHRITYQPRDPNRDLQAELKAALRSSRYLLITAPTGYGKTREAGALAQTMMQEGWRVLRIKTGWLDVPKALPEELNNNRSRVLILLDDLNGLFSTGERTESPRAEKIPLLSEANYHDRLLQVLDLLEGMCTPNEIRVIATARSETEQWKLLNFDENDKLWERFERIEIPEPADSAIVNLLEDSTRQADLKANPDEFETIAHKSDGTYRNILLNLRRWKTQNRDVSKDDLTETLNGSWEDVYNDAVKRRPAVKFIYDAIDVLRQARIELFPFVVELTAVMIWGGNHLQKFLRRRETVQSIQYLTEETNILRIANGKLTPSDGQIEAKALNLSWTIYDRPLMQLLLDLSNKRILGSIYGLAISFYYEKQFKKSHQLINRYIQLDPSDPDGHNIAGILLSNLKRYEEAEASYRKAIELNPSYATAYYNLGLLLHKNLKRYEEAEASYRKAIELNPSYATAYSNLGNLLSDENLKRYEEAEASYRKAIELNPSDATAYYNLGLLLHENLKRYEEAEASYRKAIELNPSDATAYYNLGLLLHENLKRYEEAEASYRKAIELNPSDATAYNNLSNLLRTTNKEKEALVLLEKLIQIAPEDFNPYLGIASIKKTLGESVESSFVEKARLYIPEDDFYNRACLESVCDHTDLAFEYLRKAAQKERFNPAWAWNDPDLQWLRGDPRFVKIVGQKPK